MSEAVVGRGERERGRGERNLHLGHEEPERRAKTGIARIACWDEGAVHAPVRAFRNPEYHCRSAAYIFIPRSLGDNSAIMRRVRAHI